MIWNLFFTFFKIGFLTFGGGYVMISLMEKELVEKKKWLSMDEFTEVITISQACPGVIAVNTATNLGYRIAGIKGAIVGALGAVLPSFLVIIIIVSHFLNFEENKYVVHFFNGVRPMVLAVIISVLYSFSKNILVNKEQIIWAISTFILLIFLKIHPIIVITAMISISVLRVIYKSKRS